MLKRDIWNELVKWKERKHHPLILQGLRQVGKTYIVKEFGKAYYKNVVYLDLRAGKKYHSAFEGSFDVDEMVLAISAAEPQAVFIQNETLLILDEIQDCPNVRSSLKYWDEDGRYDIIATGSFLGVKGFRSVYSRGIPVGYEEFITMYPLTFREFLSNLGINDNVISYLDECVKKNETISQPIHESIRKYYLQYLIIGGMPEAVNIFFETHDSNQIREVQRRILQSIRDDFGRSISRSGEEKINEVLKLRAEACLDSLPAQLSKEYKKFQYSLVDCKGRPQDKEDGLQYLEDLGLVIRSYNLTEISSPLEGNKKDNEFKVFLIDTGLLLSQLEEGTAAHVLKGDLGAYKGAIAENMVASTLAENGKDLYYYRGSSGSPELDFIFSAEGIPTILECKSTNRRATSMKYVLADPKKYGSHPAVKLSDTNIGKGEGFMTYPLYALNFLIRKQDPVQIVEADSDRINEAVQKLLKRS